MNKIIIHILIVSIIFSITLHQASAAGNIQLIKLDSFNIIPSDKLQLTLDNRQEHITVVKENEILYIDSKFFTDFLGIDFQKNGYPVQQMEQ